VKALRFAWISPSTRLAERLSRDERGATAVEYAIMVAFIAVVIFATVQALGQWLPAGFCAVIEGLNGTCPP
jgi:pilus assembly protein Flp/PilA